MPLATTGVETSPPFIQQAPAVVSVQHGLLLDLTWLETLNILRQQRRTSGCNHLNQPPSQQVCLALLCRLLPCPSPHPHPTRRPPPSTPQASLKPRFQAKEVDNEDFSVHHVPIPSNHPSASVPELPCRALHLSPSCLLPALWRPPPPPLPPPPPGVPEAAFPGEGG